MESECLVSVLAKIPLHGTRVDSVRRRRKQCSLYLRRFGTVRHRNGFFPVPVLHDHRNRCRTATVGSLRREWNINPDRGLCRLDSCGMRYVRLPRQDRGNQQQTNTYALRPTGPRDSQPLHPFNERRR